MHGTNKEFLDLTLMLCNILSKAHNIPANNIFPLKYALQIRATCKNEEEINEELKNNGLALQGEINFKLPS